MASKSRGKTGGERGIEYPVTAIAAPASAADADHFLPGALVVFDTSAVMFN